MMKPARQTLKRRALVCDDREENYQSIRKCLRSEGILCDPRVATEIEVRAALRASHAKRQWYDVVMLDLDLRMAGEFETGAGVYYSLLEEFPKENYVLYSSADSEKYRSVINRLMYRDVKFVLLDPSFQSLNLQLSSVVYPSNSSSVFLVHGRNREKNRRISRLLSEGFGLEIVDWDTAKNSVGGREYIFEIVLKGIEMSHLVLVLFTDDEIVQLDPSLARASENDTIAAGVRRTQARANVYIEAGYALGVRPKKTIFLDWQNPGAHLFSPSDFSGVHSIRYSDSAADREILKNKLEAARCTLSLSKSWRNRKF